METTTTPRDLVAADYRFANGAIRAAKRFARSKPWRGTVAERRSKMIAFHGELCSAYDAKFELVFSGDNADAIDSGASRASETGLEIVGRISVTTYLFLFATAGGNDRSKSLAFALNLFNRAMPRSFDRLVFDSSGMVRVDRSL